MKLQLRHFRLDDHTIELMDKIIEAPPRRLSDGPNGPVKNRTDLIRRLVWDASLDIPPVPRSQEDETPAKTTKKAASGRTNKQRK